LLELRLPVLLKGTDAFHMIARGYAERISFRHKANSTHFKEDRD